MGHVCRNEHGQTETHPHTRRNTPRHHPRLERNGAFSRSRRQERLLGLVGVRLGKDFVSLSWLGLDDQSRSSCYPHGAYFIKRICGQGFDRLCQVFQPALSPPGLSISEPLQIHTLPRRIIFFRIDQVCPSQSGKGGFDQFYERIGPVSLERSWCVGRQMSARFSIL